MTIYNFANIFTEIIEAILLFKMYETFCGKNKRFSSALYIIGFAGLAVVINICNLFFNYGVLNAVGMAVAFLIPSFLFKGKLSIKIVVSFLTIALIGIIEIMVLFCITLFLRATVSTVVHTPLYRLLGIIVSKMLTLFIVNIICVKFRKERYYIGTSYWMLFLLMFTTSIIAVFLIFKLSFDNDNAFMQNLSILCSFGLLFSTYFALYLYDHIMKQAATIRNQEQYELHLKRQLKHLDDILITQKQLKKFKHDFDNFQIGLQSYIDNGDLYGANMYLNDLRKNVNLDECTVETGNPALDAILSTKIAIAKSKGIDVNTIIQIPEYISVAPADLCVIFGNSLDNAIEACERVQTKNKKIDITIICKDKAILCKIVNTAPKPTNSLIDTSKDDKQNHGFGLENIKTALSKYNAYPTIERSDTEFTLKFVIFINE